MTSSPNLRMLATIAQALAPLNEVAVFVGGATVALYVQDPAAPQVRPTDDVDCIVELTSYASYAQLEHRLRQLGLENDSSPKAPLCRWLCAGYKVDVMPPDESVLGFTNEWYQDGIKHKVRHALPDGQEIFILSAPFFIATKIAAFLSRGEGDFRCSADMEDFIALLDGRTSLPTELREAPSHLQAYLAKHVLAFRLHSTSAKALAKKVGGCGCANGMSRSGGPRSTWPGVRLSMRMRKNGKDRRRSRSAGLPMIGRCLPRSKHCRAPARNPVRRVNGSVRLKHRRSHARRSMQPDSSIATTWPPS